MKIDAAILETWIKTQAKKRKNEEDQRILDEMLRELKMKNESQKHEHICGITEQLHTAR